MAAKHPDPLYCCDICGEEEFSEQDIRSHMLVAHIEGAISCPFCDLGDISADEMVYHVNSVHLDYLSPTADNIRFISSSDQLSVTDESLDNNNVIKCNENSPQRAHLSLNLNPDRIKCELISPRGNDQSMCPLCDYHNRSPTKLQEHVNRQHFDLTSPSFPDFINSDGGMSSPFVCPLCSRSFETSSDLELHVNMDHHDVLSPVKSTQATPGDENSNDCCPVCGCSNFICGLELASHIEEHFSPRSPNGVMCSPLTPMRLGPVGGEVNLLPTGEVSSVLDKYRVKNYKGLPNEKS